MENFFIKDRLPKILQEKFNIETIEDYLKFQKITKYEVIDEKLVINQNTTLVGVMGKLPIRIHKVNGDFNVPFNQISSFEDFPEITGSLNASSNKFENLVGMPKVGESINMNNNKLMKNLLGIQDKIDGDFSAHNCNITNLNMNKDVEIARDMNLGMNMIPNIMLDYKLIVGGSLSLSDNDVRSAKTNISAREIGLDGTPYMRKEEHDNTNDCNW